LFRRSGLHVGVLMSRPVRAGLFRKSRERRHSRAYDDMNSVEQQGNRATTAGRQ
jgi:hypothetical protein